MNFREAIICLDEYSVSIANFSGMLKPIIAQGELGEALRKVNDALMEKLKDRVKESTILSILVNEELVENREQMADFSAEWADVLEALTRVKLASNTAAEAQAEYLRETAEANDVKVKATQAGNPISIAIAEFRRRQTLMKKEEGEEYDRNMSQKSPPDLVETVNTPDQLEICVAAETVAPGSEAGTEIRIESLENAGPSAEDPGEECGTRVDTKDDAETILNWLVDLDRTSLIAFLSDEAEVARLVVVRSGRQRTALAKHREAMDYLDRVNRILTFFRDGNIAPGMSEHELSLCKSFEAKMPVPRPS
jgi:hypothetical protein